MALLWEKTVNGNNYQVKSAGNTRRIYKNGVLHSAFNPTKLFTGSVWDLLSVPALFLAPTDIKRVLMLGVGGGTVIHQLGHLTDIPRIDAVDLDKTQLMLARKFFDIKSSSRIKLHHAEAKSWLEANSHQQFDIIIDDIFIEQDGEPIRAVTSDKKWIKQLLSMLSDNGILVQNYADRNELRRSAPLSDQKLLDRFPSRFRFTTAHYENNIAVFSRQLVYESTLRQRLAALHSDKIAINRSKLSLKIRQIVSSTATAVH